MFAATAIAALLGWLVSAGKRPAPAAAPAAAEPVAATPARLVTPPRERLGVGSCTSSGCHAAAVEGHAAWQSSYTVWATRDPHARAERVLHEPLAAQIVALLAAVDPARPAVAAHENTACIGCHAPGPGRLAAEGVGCEGCHGPAGDWLVAHTLPGWRASGNTLGMVDLADPYTAARECAGCHIGGPPTAEGFSREVSHDLIAAGHPRLAFELRSFKRAEPPHWRDRFAAGPPAATASAALDPLDEWALGRLGAAHAFLDLIGRQAADPTAARAGTPAHAWPEFTALDCYGCHRPPIASLDRDAVAAGGPPRQPPGVPRLQPLQWSLLDLLLPPDAAPLLAACVAGDAATGWPRPDAALIARCLDTFDAARNHVQPALQPLPAGALARRIVGRSDPGVWDEAAAAHAALQAIADRAAARGASTAALEPATAALERLQTLLQFPGAADGQGTRFDSPRFTGPGRYDARAVSAEMETIAATLEQIR